MNAQVKISLIANTNIACMLDITILRENITQDSDNQYAGDVTYSIMGMVFTVTFSTSKSIHDLQRQIQIESLQSSVGAITDPDALDAAKDIVRMTLRKLISTKNKLATSASAPIGMSYEEKLLSNPAKHGYISPWA